jgi:hypothetical protein
MSVYFTLRGSPNVGFRGSNGQPGSNPLHRKEVTDSVTPFSLYNVSETSPPSVKLVTRRNVHLRRGESILLLFADKTRLR